MDRKPEEIESETLRLDRHSRANLAKSLLESLDDLSEDAFEPLSVRTDVAPEEAIRVQFFREREVCLAQRLAAPDDRVGALAGLYCQRGSLGGGRLWLSRGGIAAVPLDPDGPGGVSQAVSCV